MKDLENCSVQNKRVKIDLDQMSQAFKALFISSALMWPTTLTSHSLDALDGEHLVPYGSTRARSRPGRTGSSA